MIDFQTPATFFNSVFLGATNMPALGAMPGAVSSTGNLPLLVISGSILRDYLWLQAPAMARPGTASRMMGMQREPFITV